MRTFGLFIIALGVVAILTGGIVAATAWPNNQGGLPIGSLICLAVALVLGIALFVLGVVILRRTQPIGATGNFWGTSDDTTGFYPAHKELQYELDGIQYATHYTPPVKGKHARPSVLTVSTPVDCPGEFELVVETWWDKLCKRWGIAEEIETGDEKFDTECFIRTDTPAFTQAYLSDPLKRMAILDLRKFGFFEVVLSGQKLTAKRIGFNPSTDHRDDFVTDVAARLVLLSRNLPEHQPEFEERIGSTQRVWQVVLFSFLILFAATVLGLFAYPPIHTTQLLWRATITLAFGWPLYAYVSAHLLAGTSRSHVVWGSLLAMSLFLFPLGCTGSLGLFNGLLDSSAEQTHEAALVEKYTTKSKNTTNYHVRVAAWDRPGGTISFSISADEYSRVVIGQSKMVIVTHEGALGVEWLKSKRLKL